MKPTTAELLATMDALRDRLAFTRRLLLSTLDEVAHLRRVLSSEAEKLEDSTEPSAARSSAFWFAAWKESMRQRASEKAILREMDRRERELEIRERKLADRDLSGSSD